MSVSLDNTNQICSNIYLIDSSLCLSNSYGLINFNVQTLSSAIFNFEKNHNFWYGLYTIFTAHSANWLKATNNILNYSSDWIDAFTVVNTTSSTWIGNFTLIYPTMMEINSWYAMNSSSQTSIIKNWLDINFNANTYNPNQIIDIVVYLYQTIPFSFNYNKTYTENCNPNSVSAAVDLNCDVCRPPKNVGCNHDSNGKHWCDNALLHCKKTTTGISAKTNCNGYFYKYSNNTNTNTLTLNYSISATDINTARTVNFRFKNINYTWTTI
jgi:hypothetical protein